MRTLRLLAVALFALLMNAPAMAHEDHRPGHCHEHGNYVPDHNGVIRMVPIATHCYGQGSPRRYVRRDYVPPHIVIVKPRRHRGHGGFRIRTRDFDFGARW